VRSVGGTSLRAVLSNDAAKHLARMQAVTKARQLNEMQDPDELQERRLEPPL
jgi:hypothetical protein